MGLLASLTYLFLLYFTISLIRFMKKKKKKRFRATKRNHVSVTAYKGILYILCCPRNTEGSGFQYVTESYVNVY